MYCLLLLLPLVSAKLPENLGHTVTITLEPTAAETTIKIRGEDIKLPTDSEITLFNLTTDKLTKAVEAHTGKKPQDVFIKGPTPWNDLYKSYEWREVKRDFKLNKIEVVNVTAQEKEEALKIYKNNGTESAIFKGVSYTPHWTFRSTHSWDHEGISSKVRYELTRRANSDLDYAYDSIVGQFGFGNGISTITYVEVTAKFRLNPGQKAKFIVKATEIETNILAEYEIILIGDVVVNYSDKYKGHHFWAFDVNELLPLINSTGVIKINEMVNIVYLRNFKLEVIDADTGTQIPFTDFTNSSPV